MADTVSCSSAWGGEKDPKKKKKRVCARPLLHSTSQQRCIISTSGSFPVTFSRSDMTEQHLCLLLCLVSAAAIRPFQINAGELRAHVKIYHCEEQSTASAPTCSTVIHYSAWSEEEVIRLCNSLLSPSASSPLLFSLCHPSPPSPPPPPSFFPHAHTVSRSSLSSLPLSSSSV